MITTFEIDNNDEHDTKAADHNQLIKMMMTTFEILIMMIMISIS